MPSEESARGIFQEALAFASDRDWVVYPYVYRSRKGDKAKYHFVVIKNKKFKWERGDGVITELDIEFQEFIGRYPNCRDRKRKRKDAFAAGDEDEDAKIAIMRLRRVLDEYVYQTTSTSDERKLNHGSPQQIKSSSSWRRRWERIIRELGP